uniref:Dishevelled n=1 Tax=Parastrongyloides trichosuri TaxID=131310 RepID=A0A0N4ZIE5_PARTI
MAQAGSSQDDSIPLSRPNESTASLASSTDAEDNNTVIEKITGKMAQLNNESSGAFSDGDGLSEISIGNSIPASGTLKRNTGNGSQASLVTKVYYHIDDDQTPFLSEIPVPPDRCTLGDFKRVLNKSNYKFFIKLIDPEINMEVKRELKDDNELIAKAATNNMLYLLTSEGSTISDLNSHNSRPLKSIHNVPAPAPNGGVFGLNSLDAAYKQARHVFDSSMMTTDSESFISSIRPVDDYKNSYNNRNNRLLMGYGRGMRRNHFDESESEFRAHSDDESRVSTSTDITSVSRQHLYRRRKNRKKYRQPSRASSFTSITESSMCLDVITVTLNIDTVNFLGISIVGQSSARGDNGIYVANVMKGGAVALDGRIEPGDMILQVNDVSFENFTNDQAVDVLRSAVARKGPIKLTVAKSFDSGTKNCFNKPDIREEPVRPIDTEAWIQHTNAMCEIMKKGGVMPSILEGSEGAPTPVPGQRGPYHNVIINNGRQSGSLVTSNDSDGTPSTVIGMSNNHQMLGQQGQRLSIGIDHKIILRAMAMPNSGLDIKDRTWLKIPIPSCFLGSDLVDWLVEHVDGIRDRKEGKKFASELLKEKLIAHVVNKNNFTEQCYYVFANSQDILNDGAYLPPPPPGLTNMGTMSHNGQWTSNHHGPSSIISGYASMPISPFPGQNVMLPPRVPADLHSQASGTSNDGSSSSEHRRVKQSKVILPPAPSLNSVPTHYASTGILLKNGVPPRIDQMPTDLSGSRQSFRIAMNNPYEFFIDNL